VISGNKLVPGDIILVDTHNLLAVFVKVATSGAYSHAALYIGDSLIIHAVPAGIFQFPLESLATDSVRRIKVLRLKREGMKKNKYEQRLRGVVRYAVSQHFRDYDFDALKKIQLFYAKKLVFIRTGYPVTKGYRAKFICSGLIANAYAAVGVRLVKGIGAGMVTPNDLFRSPLLEPVSSVLEMKNKKEIGWEKCHLGHNMQKRIKQLRRFSETGENILNISEELCSKAQKAMLGSAISARKMLDDCEQELSLVKKKLGEIEIMKEQITKLLATSPNLDQESRNKIVAIAENMRARLQNEHRNLEKDLQRKKLHIKRNAEKIKRLITKADSQDTFAAFLNKKIEVTVQRYNYLTKEYEDTSKKLLSLTQETITLLDTTK
jgi:uncharacterized protein YycO